MEEDPAELDPPAVVLWEGVLGALENVVEYGGAPAPRPAARHAHILLDIQGLHGGGFCKFCFVKLIITTGWRCFDYCLTSFRVCNRGGRKFFVVRFLYFFYLNLDAVA